MVLDSRYSVTRLIYMSRLELYRMSRVGRGGTRTYTPGRLTRKDIWKERKNGWSEKRGGERQRERVFVYVREMGGGEESESHVER